MRTSTLSLSLILLAAFLTHAPGILAQTSPSTEGSGTATEPLVIPKPQWSVGDAFTYEIWKQGNLEAVRSFVVMGEETITVGGKTYETWVYGWKDLAPRERVYKEYRDKATFGLIKVEESSYTMDPLTKKPITAHNVKTFSPGYFDRVFPLETNVSWSGDAYATYSTRYDYADPASGKLSNISGGKTGIVRYAASATEQETLNTSFGWIPTLRVVLIDASGGSNRSDRYSWAAGIPVPVRVLRFNGSDLTDVLQLRHVQHGDAPTATMSSPAPALSKVAIPLSLNVTDPGQRVKQFKWVWGDGTSPLVTAASAVTHTYARPGTYRGHVNVSDVYNYTLTVPFEATILNRAPVALINGSLQGTVGEPLALDASLGPPDEDGKIVNYTWAFSDGVARYGLFSTRTFNAPSDDLTVTLTVTDDSGAVSTATAPVSITAPEAANSTSPAAGSTSQGESIPPILSNLTLVAGPGDDPSWDISFNASDTSGIALLRLSLNDEAIATVRGTDTLTVTIGASAFRDHPDAYLTSEAYDRWGNKATKTQLVQAPTAQPDRTAPWLDDLNKTQNGDPASKSDPASTQGNSGLRWIPSSGLVGLLAGVCAASLARRGMAWRNR